MPVARCESVAELIKQRVVSGLHLGLLTHGARLPSVRDLSTEVRANPRVVMAAYRQLEAEGLVEVQERSGIFVTPKAKQSRVGRADLVVETLLEGIRHGIPPIELPEIMKRGLARRARRAIVLECNDDQLFSIGEELRHDFGLDVQAVDLNARRVQPMRDLELRSADFFITTSFHAADVRKLSEQHNVPCIVLTMCVELFCGRTRATRARAGLFRGHRSTLCEETRADFRRGPRRLQPSGPGKRPGQSR